MPQNKEDQMKNLKEKYIEKANNLIERLLDEQPEDEEEEAPEETPEEETPEGAEDEETEQGQAEQIEVFFDNLDEGSQKVLMDALKENLNVAEDDDYAQKKIIDALSKEPLITFRAEELVRKLNLDI